MVDYDERTPDSGCYSVVSGVKTSISTADFGLESSSNNLSYLKYINTFAQPHHDETNCSSINEIVEGAVATGNNNELATITSRDELNRMNVLELNEFIEQIESTSKELSDILVHVIKLS